MQQHDCSVLGLSGLSEEDVDTANQFAAVSDVRQVVCWLSCHLLPSFLVHTFQKQPKNNPLTLEASELLAYWNRRSNTLNLTCFSGYFNGFLKKRLIFGTKIPKMG